MESVKTWSILVWLVGHGSTVPVWRLRCSSSEEDRCTWPVSSVSSQSISSLQSVQQDMQQQEARRLEYWPWWLFSVIRHSITWVSTLLPTVRPPLYLLYSLVSSQLTCLKAYLVELFPFTIRSKGITMQQWWGRAATFCNTFINPIGMDNIGWRYYIWYCCWITVEGFVIYFFFPETAGRTLEELSFCKSLWIPSCSPGKSAYWWLISINSVRGWWCQGRGYAKGGETDRRAWTSWNCYWQRWESLEVYLGDDLVGWISQATTKRHAGFMNLIFVFFVLVLPNKYSRSAPVS